MSVYVATYSCYMTGDCIGYGEDVDTLKAACEKHAAGIRDVPRVMVATYTIRSTAYDQIVMRGGETLDPSAPIAWVKE